MMNKEQVQKIVVEVIGRVAGQLGADGSRGTLVVILCGATVGLPEGFHQIRRLLLDGYQVELSLTDAAMDIYGPLAMSQLDGFPHWEVLDKKNWFPALSRSTAVVIPSLSINTLSKLSQLVADNTATNLAMHGLLMGKPVVMARNGAEPDSRQAAGMGAGQAPALHRALKQRIQTMASYGARLVDVDHLRDTLNACLTGNEQRIDHKPHQERALDKRTVEKVQGRTVTAVHVRKAYRKGVDLSLARGAIVSPLAKDLASQFGVKFIHL